MITKEFKTIDEQIEILKSRGLSIPDNTVARDFLLRNNYYRISGYSLTLRSHDIFNPNVTFQNIADIYEFDHELRHILLQYIETIEVTVKSIYAYEFTKEFDPNGYLDHNHFSDISKHKEIIDKGEKQKELRLPHEAYLKHYVIELQQDIPLWAYVDLLTISDISFLYTITEQSVKDAVAMDLGLNIQGAALLSRFMHSLTIIRNLCAHGSRLFNRLFEQKPWLSKKEQKFLRKSSNGSIDNAHLFSFILIMRRMLRTEEFCSLKEAINHLSKKYPFVNMVYYGFPDNWDTLI